MAEKKPTSSPVGELSSGVESPTVKEYDPAKEEGQLGKEHEEEVAPKNNWEDDKRDEIGRAARKKKLAKKLRRIARELEALDVDVEEEYMDAIEEIQDQAEEEATGKSPDGEAPEDLGYMLDNEATDDESLIIEATHPIEHDESDDNPEANMSSQTGDDEWIDIGPGEFDDKRDEVGRAA